MEKLIKKALRYWIATAIVIGVLVGLALSEYYDRMNG